VHTQLAPSFTGVDTTFGRATVTTRWVLSNALTAGATYTPRLRVRGFNNGSTAPAYDVVVDGTAMLVQAQYVHPATLQLVRVLMLGHRGSQCSLIGNAASKTFHSPPSGPRWAGACNRMTIDPECNRACD
jgi:hypothetical protein